ncbi:MAG: hypothetical protein OEW12_02690 [Deltaproteobacteria bacterium]|nr:hypothetical protein [Deltaproteobacteria bacterium]
MKNLFLTWKFLNNLPMEYYLSLASWHLVAILGGLALLGGIGLHHLLGYVAGWYRIGGKNSKMMAFPTQWVLMGYLVGMVTFYMVGVRAHSLVQFSLSGGGQKDPTPVYIGQQVLAPAFDNSQKTRIQTEFTRNEVELALYDSPATDLRAAYSSRSMELVRVENPAASRMLAAMALNWLADPEQAPPAWYTPPEPQPGSENLFPLQPFLASLITDVGDEVLLPRKDWEHMVGQKMQTLVTAPILLANIRYYAWGGAALFTFALLNYLFLLNRWKKWVITRQHRKKESKTESGFSAKDKPKPTPPEDEPTDKAVVESMGAGVYYQSIQNEEDWEGGGGEKRDGSPGKDTKTPPSRKKPKK